MLGWHSPSRVGDQLQLIYLQHRKEPTDVLLDLTVTRRWRLSAPALDHVGQITNGNLDGKVDNGEQDG